MMNELTEKWEQLFKKCGLDYDVQPKVEGYDPDFVLRGVKVEHENFDTLYIKVLDEMDRRELSRVNDYILGDLEKRRETMNASIEEQIEHGWQMDYPLGQAECIKSLLILGEMPQDADFDNLKDWIMKTYPNHNHYKGLFYSEKTFEGRRYKGYDRIFPCVDYDGEFRLQRVDRIKGDALANTREIFYEVRNTSDHKGPHHNHDHCPEGRHKHKPGFEW